MTRFLAAALPAFFALSLTILIPTTAPAAERRVEAGPTVEAAVRFVKSVPVSELGAEVDHISELANLDEMENDLAFSHTLDVLTRHDEALDSNRRRMAVLLLASHPELLDAYRSDLSLEPAQRERLDRLVARLADSPVAAGTLERARRIIDLGQEGWGRRLSRLFDDASVLTPDSDSAVAAEAVLSTLAKTPAGREQLQKADAVLAQHGGVVARAVMSIGLRHIYQGRTNELTVPNWHEHFDRLWTDPTLAHLPDELEQSWGELRASAVWKALEPRYMERAKAWLAAQFVSMNPPSIQTMRQERESRVKYDVPFIRAEHSPSGIELVVDRYTPVPSDWTHTLGSDGDISFVLAKRAFQHYAVPSDNGWAHLHSGGTPIVGVRVETHRGLLTVSSFYTARELDRRAPLR